MILAPLFVASQLARFPLDAINWIKPLSEMCTSNLLAVAGAGHCRVAQALNLHRSSPKALKVQKRMRF